MWHSWNRATKFGKSNTTLVVPSFTISDVVWLGSSIILTEFDYDAVEDFTFHFPLSPAISYVLAVRYEDFNGNIVRYKFWENIGEVLYYSLYSGQVIGSNFTIEVWSVEDQATVELDVDTSITMGILIDPSSCCVLGSSTETSTENADLFSAYPYTWEVAYNQTYEEV